MSNKYIYGYTNDLSYDLCKVIYFGKQDRLEENLIRAKEHLSGSDINQKFFLETKYILVAQVETGISVSDIESYLIKIYSPSLNNVGNHNKSKISKANENKIEEEIKNLKWYLIENSDEVFNHLKNTFTKIDSIMKSYKSAKHVFDSVEEFRKTTSFTTNLFLSKGLVFIKPVIENTAECPVYRIEPTSDRKKFILHDLVRDHWITMSTDLTIEVAK